MIYTSYFANVKNLPSGMIPIAICGGVPEWWCGLQYKKLAPKRGFFRITKYSSGFKDAMQKYLQGDWIKYDKYFDFWEIDMACPAEGDTPMAIGKDTVGMNLF